MKVFIFHKMASYSSIFAWNPVDYPWDMKSLVGYSPWGHKESDTAERTKQACNILSFSFKTHRILTSKRNTQKILN